MDPFGLSEREKEMDRQLEEAIEILSRNEFTPADALECKDNIKLLLELLKGYVEELTLRALSEKARRESQLCAPDAWLTLRWFYNVAALSEEVFKKIHTIKQVKQKTYTVH
jgi:hypothetical protein